MFKIEMDKNSGVLYPLETGNRAWNDFKINNRATILFEKEEKKEIKINILKKMQKIKIAFIIVQDVLSFNMFLFMIIQVWLMTMKR